MAETFDTTTTNPGFGGANLCGAKFTQGAVPEFLPACYLVFGPHGGPYTAVDVTAGLPVQLVAAADSVPVTGTVSVANFPTTQAVSGTVSVGNFPATQPVSGTVAVSNLPATQPVSGTVSVGNFPGTQPVSGTVSVGNFPATQPVSGTVAVSNLPGTQLVSGTVSVGNFPASQPVSGTVAVSGSVAVTGTFWQATQPISLAAAVTVVGPAAAGAAVAGNPVLAAGSDGTNAQALATDTAGRLLQPTGRGSLATGQVAVSATAGQVVAARAGRRAVAVVNQGTKNVYLGASGVTSSTGIFLPGIPGAAVEFLTTAAVYAVTAGSDTSTVSYAEEY